MELNADTRSVNEIFSPSKKYVVPRFQREYSWQAEEVKEFWEDVVERIHFEPGAVKNEEYFIGCIVLIGEDRKTEFQIVDGQQRLTTLTIFLRVIVDRLQELGDTEAAWALYGNTIEAKDNDGKRYFKLENESPKPFFQNELQALNHAGLSKAVTEEEQLLQATYELLKKQLRALSPQDFSPLEVVKAVRDQVLNYLKFILVSATSEEDAYTIFETLNARGLSLSSVDLIKNWIFKNYQDTHPNDNAKTLWNDLRMRINKFSELETFFRHYWNSKYAFISDDRLYKSFKDAVRKGYISGARDFLLELREAASQYERIGVPQDKDWPVQKEKVVKKALDNLNQYRVTQVRPLLLALLACRSAKSIDQATFIRTISSIENFHFAFSNICQERASGLDGRYARVAKNLYAAGKSRAKVKAELEALDHYLDSKWPRPIRLIEAIQALSFGNGVDMHKRSIQTLFVKVERYLHGTSELTVDAFSIEHIADQASGAAWVNRIGNLLPLDEGINNNMKSGLSFASKKAKYKKSRFKVVEEFLRLFPGDEWNEVDAKKWAVHLVELFSASCDRHIVGGAALLANSVFD